MAAFQSLRSKDLDALRVAIVDDCTLGSDEAEVKAASLIEPDHGRDHGCVIIIL